MANGSDPIREPMKGRFVINLDDAGDHLVGSAWVIETGSQQPAVFADLSAAPIPKDKNHFNLTVPLSTRPHQWDGQLPTTAETEWKVQNEQIVISWNTDIQTRGTATVDKSEGDRASVLKSMSKITNRDQFRRFARELEPYRFVFRGQRRNDWRLRTSFHRTKRSSLHIYDQQDIPYLHGQFSGMMKRDLDIRDPTHLAAFYNLLQHHGYPTPLLDWTYSPFVAAYFAFNSAGHDNDNVPVRFFVLDKKNWLKDFNSISQVNPPGLHFSMLDPLPLNNPRAIPQKAASSLTNVEDIETYLATREAENSKEYLSAIDLPSEERDVVMRELNLMGIPTGSLFPGIDGVCEQARALHLNLQARRSRCLCIN